MASTLMAAAVNTASTTKEPEAETEREPADNESDPNGGDDTSTGSVHLVVEIPDAAEEINDEICFWSLPLWKGTKPRGPVVLEAFDGTKYVAQTPKGVRCTVSIRIRSDTGFPILVIRNNLNEQVLLASTITKKEVFNPVLGNLSKKGNLRMTFFCENEAGEHAVEGTFGIKLHSSLQNDLAMDMQKVWSSVKNTSTDSLDSSLSGGVSQAKAVSSKAPTELNSPAATSPPGLPLSPLSPESRAGTEVDDLDESFQDHGIVAWIEVLKAGQVKFKPMSNLCLQYGICDPPKEAEVTDVAEHYRKHLAKSLWVNVGGELELHTDVELYQAIRGKNFLGWGALKTAVFQPVEELGLQGQYKMGRMTKAIATKVIFYRFFLPLPDFTRMGQLFP